MDSSAGPFGVGIIYGYFIVGTIISRLLLPPITKWAARVERAEGDFRYLFIYFFFFAVASFQI